MDSSILDEIQLVLKKEAMIQIRYVLMTVVRNGNIMLFPWCLVRYATISHLDFGLSESDSCISDHLSSFVKDCL